MNALEKIANGEFLSRSDTVGLAEELLQGRAVQDHQVGVMMVTLDIKANQILPNHLINKLLQSHLPRKSDREDDPYFKKELINDPLQLYPDKEFTYKEEKIRFEETNPHRERLPSQWELELTHTYLEKTIPLSGKYQTYVITQGEEGRQESHVVQISEPSILSAYLENIDLIQKFGDLGLQGGRQVFVDGVHVGNINANLPEDDTIARVLPHALSQLGRKGPVQPYDSTVYLGEFGGDDDGLSRTTTQRCL